MRLIVLQLLCLLLCLDRVAVGQNNAPLPIRDLYVQVLNDVDKPLVFLNFTSVEKVAINELKFTENKTLFEDTDRA